MLEIIHSLVRYFKEEPEKREAYVALRPSGLTLTIPLRNSTKVPLQKYYSTTLIVDKKINTV